ncbi:GerMN domain-containing protein [Vallitalea pronyensis]|uniref:GerMN domain-containing protein n=1 Tax=Vallitalea pronyensis TaxID=1348613 RepID=A0A8J8MLV1_9FIRM|nr:GerMN domain-containing protein [Vallitalea pronyensis]QUI23886.1 GerMN domain-containing protein [Vallitalea pronyensis]
MGKIIRICFLCLFILMLITGCGNKKTESTDKTPDLKTEMITLKSSNDNKWIEKEVTIQSVGKEEVVREIFAFLQNGIEDQDVVSTIPTDIVLKDVAFDGAQVNLNFSEDYNKMEASDETICRTSLASSLTNLSYIDAVSFQVNDIPLKGTDGKPMSPMTKEQLVLGDPEKEPKTVRKVMLYFATVDASGLVPHEVEIEVNPNEPLEKTVLNLLLEGPNNEDEVSTIPEGTKVISTSISEGVCYVDFNNDFITKHPGGSTGENLTIYSIVNTLTELPDIKKVQFLIEGEKQAVFKGHIAFDTLFERNLDIVITD